MNTNKFFQLIFASLLGLVLIFGFVQPALAQSGSGYMLEFNRDFGFGNGSQVRGKCSIILVGNQENVQSVTFTIDGKPMVEMQAAPFRYQFNTDNYGSGIHDMGAVVVLKDGQTLTLDTLRYQFLSADEESKAMQRIFIPLVGGILLLMAIGMGSQFLIMGRGRSDGIAAGTARNYGFVGGTICRHCGRPTPRHIWGINLLVGKLDRCENCGKWSMMRAMPMDILRAAEQAELAAEKSTLEPLVEKSEEEKLREMLDRSKYSN